MATQPADSSAAALAAMRAAVAAHRTQFMVLGLALILLGIVAVAFPLLTTIAAKIFLGWLFLIGGAVQITHAFSTRNWSEFLLNLLVGALYLVAGAWLAFLPFTGILTLTILLAMMFIVQGVAEATMAFRLRPLPAWAWMLISGVIAGAVGLMIIAELPSSAAWAIGLLVGINMISSDWAYVILALAAGKNS